MLALAAGHAAAGIASGQALERQTDRYAPPGPMRTTRPAVPPPSGPDNVTTQVNVNAAQQNIIGDAANEPSIAVDPTAPNRIVIGWRQFDTVTSNFRQAGRAWSNDGGRTWHNPGPLDPGVFRSDPVLRADANGVIRYLSLTNTGPNGFSCQMFTSTNGGSAFGGAVQATGGDKPWFAIDTTTSTGRGFLYQAWSLGGLASQAFSRSIDGGATWQSPLTTLPVWGTLAVNGVGDLYIGGIPFAGSSATTFLVARSTNARNSAVTPFFQTFNVPMGGSIGFSVANGPNPGGLLGQAWIGVDTSGGPRNGWVYLLASVVTTSGDPCDVMFNRSTDGGQTWLSTPIRVNNDAPGNWQWFGTLGVAPNGRLDVVWNDTRESGQASLSRPYYAFSNDGGTTWQGNTPVGAEFNSLVGFPNQNKIGDYSDIVSDRVGAFVTYSATYNNEEDVYFLRINDYDCNGNGVPDAIDLANGTLHDCNGNGIPDECEIAAGVQVVCTCYANCDGSTTSPMLTVNDFICFQSRFAAGDPYANCDGSTTVPTLTVNDFICFQSRFAAGCSTP
jgi:hypothetical protein